MLTFSPRKPYKTNAKIEAKIIIRESYREKTKSITFVSSNNRKSESTALLR
jgi:hypothetical protein